jgi:hypothetical protein
MKNLHYYGTGDFLREATQDEINEASRHPYGFIWVTENGKRVWCYIENVEK